MSDIELKPCPMCGGKPTSMWNDASNGQGSDDCGFWSIECCHIHVHVDDEPDAIAAWNTRFEPERGAVVLHLQRKASALDALGLVWLAALYRDASYEISQGQHFEKAIREGSVQ